MLFWTKEKGGGVGVWDFKSENGWFTGNWGRTGPTWQMSFCEATRNIAPLSQIQAQGDGVRLLQHRQAPTGDHTLPSELCLMHFGRNCSVLTVTWSLQTKAGVFYFTISVRCSEWAVIAKHMNYFINQENIVFQSVLLIQWQTSKQFSKRRCAAWQYWKAEKNTSYTSLGNYSNDSVIITRWGMGLWNLGNITPRN